MSFTEIVLELDAASQVAVLTLNRPERLNSFTRQMHAELRAALDTVEHEGMRALVVTGAGRAFCAGQDLSDLELGTGGSGMSDLGEVIADTFNPLVRRLQTLPLPVIAAVNGTAAGAGANLALACDLALAARSAKFIQAFVKIGLVPDTGGTWALPRRIGMARALGLALTGDAITADQAEAWGMIWRAVDAEALHNEAMLLATRLAAQPTRAIAAIKHAMHTGATQTLDQSLDLEAQLQRELGQSHDYLEGVNAFLEKRSPLFTGR
jgi:2-(1,2-epoxy-1,2-dihydrophenyl)acetyl-CoA isomerase